MAGDNKWRKRQAMIDTARMLGYSITPYTGASGTMCYVVTRDGNPLCFGDHPEAGELPPWMVSTPIIFKHMWRAAAFALKKDGIDARTLAPSRENGVGESRVPTIFELRNQLERASDRAYKASRRRR